MQSYDSKIKTNGRDSEYPPLSSVPSHLLPLPRSSQCHGFSWVCIQTSREKQQVCVAINSSPLSHEVVTLHAAHLRYPFPLKNTSRRPTRLQQELPPWLLWLRGAAHGWAAGPLPSCASTRRLPASLCSGSAPHVCLGDCDGLRL